MCQYDDTLFSFEVSVNYIFAYSVLVVTSISQNIGLIREYFGCISIFSGTIVLLHYDSKVRRRAHVLFALCVYSGVKQIMCCVLALFVVVLCIVYPMLLVSLDCLYLIGP